VTTGEDIPIHPPVPSIPVAGLRSRLGGLIDTDGSGLELDGGTGNDAGSEDVVWTTVLGEGGDGRVCAVPRPLSAPGDGG